MLFVGHAHSRQMSCSGTQRSEVCSPNSIMETGKRRRFSTARERFGNARSPNEVTDRRQSPLTNDHRRLPPVSILPPRSLPTTPIRTDPAMLHPNYILRGAASSAHPLSSAASPSSLLSALPRLAAHRRFLSSVAPAVPYKTHHPTPGFPHSPLVHTFFQDTTATWTFLVTCPGSRDAILVDPALDYDPASGKVETTTAKGIMAFVREMGYKVVRIIETHVRPHISCCWTCVSLLTDSRSTTFLAFTHLRRSTPIISQLLRFGGTYVCLVGFPALPRAERRGSHVYARPSRPPPLPPPSASASESSRFRRGSALSMASPPLHMKAVSMFFSRTTRRSNLVRLKRV